jgi:hypothetical protein
MEQSGAADYAYDNLPYTKINVINQFLSAGGTLDQGGCQ